MKFDPLAWEEVKTNEQVEVAKGRLRLQVSAPVAVYVEAEGVESLAGYAASFTFEFSEAVKVRIEAGKGVRAFRHNPLPAVTSVATDEVYTNADRMPYESGILAEVTRARRMLELERRQMMADMKREMAVAKASIRKARVESGLDVAAVQPVEAAAGEAVAAAKGAAE